MPGWKERNVLVYLIEGDVAAAEVSWRGPQTGNRGSQSMVACRYACAPLACG
jgi:hypothetical protein